MSLKKIKLNLKSTDDVWAIYSEAKIKAIVAGLDWASIRKNAMTGNVSDFHKIMRVYFVFADEQ